jgi:tRNA(Ile)-lysidine synthase TilS/MesJ
MLPPIRKTYISPLHQARFRKLRNLPRKNSLQAACCLHRRSKFSSSGRPLLLTGHTFDDSLHNLYRALQSSNQAGRK